MGALGPGPSDRTLAEVATRRRAAARAGHTGEADLAAALAEDPDPSVRAVAVGALNRLGRLSAATLARAAADPEPSVRRRATELIATVRAAADEEEGQRELLDGALRARLDDPDTRVVEVAAWATGERHGADPDHPGPAVAPAWVVDELSALAIGHDDPLVREAAVAALGSVGDPRGLPAVLAGCSDKATVRRRAVLALAPFEGPDVDAALARATNDRDRQVRQVAEDLLDPDR